MKKSETVYYLSPKYKERGRTWMDVIKNVDGHDVGNYASSYRTIKQYKKDLKREGVKNARVVRLFKKDML